jgi:hypothetical protein
MQGVPQLTLFLFAARALIGSKNNFFWLTTSAPTALQRAITGLGGDYWLLTLQDLFTWPLRRTTCRKSYSLINPLPSLS